MTPSPPLKIIAPGTRKTGSLAAAQRGRGGKWEVVRLAGL